MHETSIRELEYRLQVSDQERMRLKKRLMGLCSHDRSSVLSMLDMMTLLLVFFVMMYVKSAVTEIHQGTHPLDPEAPARETHRPPPVAAAQSPPLQDPPVNETPPAPPEPASSPQALSEPSAAPPDPAVERLREEIADLIREEGAEGTQLQWDQKRLVFVLGERVTFDPGQANLLTDFTPVLSKIAGIIAQRPEYRLLVSGHTDDRPISTPSFPSNWELSAARAIAVAKFLSGNGVGPERIVVQGFGEYQPMVPNSSAGNRQLNRRVEIRMVRPPPESGRPETH